METSTIILIVIVLLTLLEICLLVSTLYFETSDNYLVISTMPVIFIAIAALAAAYAYCKDLEIKKDNERYDLNVVSERRKKIKKNEETKNILKRLENFLTKEDVKKDNPNTNGVFDSLQPNSDEEKEEKGEKEEVEDEKEDDDDKPNDGGNSIVQKLEEDE